MTERELRLRDELPWFVGRIDDAFTLRTCQQELARRSRSARQQQHREKRASAISGAGGSSTGGGGGGGGSGGDGYAPPPGTSRFNSFLTAKATIRAETELAKRQVRSEHPKVGQCHCTLQ